MDEKSEKVQHHVSEAIPDNDSNSIIRADDARLAELGYKSEFRREFSVRFVVLARTAGFLIVSPKHDVVV